MKCFVLSLFPNNNSLGLEMPYMLPYIHYSEHPHIPAINAKNNTLLFNFIPCLIKLSLNYYYIFTSANIANLSPNPQTCRRIF